MKSILLSILLLTIAFASQTSAQNKKPASMGTLSGQVVDCNDAVIQNAVVILKNKKITRKMLTNFEGYFEFEVPYGKYELVIEPANKGFSKFREENVEITYNSALDLKITLGTMGQVIRDLY